MLRVLAVSLLVALVGAAGASTPPRVEYEDDRLTVRLEEVEIGDVLAALGRATGAEVWGAPLGPRRVTADFDRVPLAAAITRLLGEQNFTLRYGEGGRPKAIVLRGGPEAPAPPPPAPTTTTVPAAQASPPTTIGLPRRFSEHRPLAVPEGVAEVIGLDHATFDQIFALATTAADGRVRNMALQLALSALERERVLRRALFLDLRRGADGSLGAFLQGPPAIEMLEFLAAHSREPGLQKKAQVLLDEVRPPAGQAPAGG